MSVRGFILLTTFGWMTQVQADPAGNGGWIAAWSSSAQLVSSRDEGEASERKTTSRHIVRVRAAGQVFRFKFSNLFGTKSLKLGPATVGVRRRRASLKEVRAVEFDGRPTASIPPGAVAWSDPVTIPGVGARSAVELGVSFEAPADDGCRTGHAFKVEASYLGHEPDRVSTRRWHFPFPESPRCYLTGVDVRASRPARVVVALGDSLTDGVGSTGLKYMRWTDELDRCLHAHGQNEFMILNAGIGGTRLLRDSPGPPGLNFSDAGLLRFTRDVLPTSGLTDVIVLLGTNDIGRPGASAPAPEKPTLQSLKDGFSMLIREAHEHRPRIRIHPGTIPPFEGDSYGYYSREKNLLRERLNSWLRTNRSPDSVIDFDKVIRDPSSP